VLKCAGVVNAFASEGTALVGGDVRHSDSPSVIGREFDLATVAAFIDVNDCSNITHGKPLVPVLSGQHHAIQLFDRVLWDRDPILLSRLTFATPRQDVMQEPLERGSAPTGWADPAAQILASLHLCGFNHVPSGTADCELRIAALIS
jgi:hypothetical protein